MAAGDRAGERYWQLPLIDDYVPEMDSWYGDLQNSGSPEGSLVKSGLFLREFVTKPWVHLDIAGTAYYRKATPVRAARRDRRLARDPRRAGARRRPGRLTDPPAVRPRRRTADRRPDGAARRLLGRGRLRARPRRRPVRDALAGARRGASARPAGRLADGRRARSSGRWRSGCCRCGSASDPLALALFGAWFVTLIVGLATDLDQRLLPDVLTLPVIPVALVYALSGANPLVGTELVPAVVAAVAIPAVLYLPSIPFGAGAFGIGDVKLLVGRRAAGRRRAGRSAA